MLIDQKESRAVLRRIVFKVTTDRALHDDLTQEACVHIWLRETQCPGWTKSWYFQSCRFFLQNLLRTSRSVDSARHQRNLGSPAEARDDTATVSDADVPGDSVLALVSAREAVGSLEKWLSPPERQILGLLVEGYAVPEIAAKLAISHTSIIRHRRRIAGLASRLGILPPLPADRPTSDRPVSIKERALEVRPRSRTLRSLDRHKTSNNAANPTPPFL